MSPHPILIVSLASLIGCSVPTAEPVADAGSDMPCHETPSDKTYVRRTAAVTLPEVVLTDQAGQSFPIQGLAELEGPVALNFIFTTCTTICPVMTATFASARAELGDDASRVHMVSISIDPQHDTPAVLADYAANFDAPAQWRFLTGEPAQIDTVLEALDADFTTKYDHEPLTLLRRPGDPEWIRLEGLGNAAALAKELKALLDGPRVQ